MKKIILLLSLFLCSYSLIAQDLLIKGTVKDDNGEFLPGVAILEKGTSNGTITDASGVYSIRVNKGATLVYSFVGMQTKEVSVGEKTEINIVLSGDVYLDDVVVAALGIRREKKTITYSIQDVKAEEIVIGAEPNLVNSLAGKVAGLTVTNSGGAPGASSQIIIRGGTSLLFDNQPLFVVDGVPVDNTTAVGNSLTDGLSASSLDMGNAISDLNPDDIAEMTVLKGAAASALYGLKAANGAIVITTKKGKGKAKVNFSFRTRLDQVNQLPSQQGVYKAGTADRDGGNFTDQTHLSWGEEFQSGDTRYNNMEDFFENAWTYETSFNVSGGNEKGSYYISLAHTDQDGVVPTTDYQRSSFLVNLERKEGIFTFGTKFNYVSTSSTKTLTGSGLYGTNDGYMQNIINYPRSYDMKVYEDEEGNLIHLLPDGLDAWEYPNNPYWKLNTSPQTTGRERYISNAHIDADLTSWLKASYRVGLDYYNNNYKSIREVGTTSLDWYRGGISENNTQNSLITSLFTISGNKEITTGLQLDYVAGHNVEILDNKSQSLVGQVFIEPTFKSLNNIAKENKDLTVAHRRRRLIGVFGDLRLSYNNTFLFGATYRNDWSSTLPKENNSFDYYSGNVGVIVSELLPKNGVLTYGKIRASVAQVGKDAPMYMTTTAVKQWTGPGGGYLNEWSAGNSELKPETTTSIEAGFDANLWIDRLGVNFTWYRERSEDQIIQPRVSQSTGYILKYINDGSIQNKGIELTISAKPIKKPNFSWDIIANVTKNEGTVLKLPETLPILYVTDTQFGFAKAGAVLDGPFLGIIGQKWETVEEGEYAGRVVIGSDGYPVTNNDYTNLMGNREPDLMLGITNQFTYKNWSFNMLWDLRFGGDVLNATEWAMVNSGLSETTLDRGTTKVFDGVVLNGDGTYSENTQSAVLNQYYYQNIYTQEASHFIENVNWVRLRTVNLTYVLPKSLTTKLHLSRASVSLIGNNLLLFTNYSGMDPEVSMSGAGSKGSGSSGVDYCGVPATKSMSVGLNISF
nr:SusC/RagA family TonB-linked outer membrane protein [uncultured Carboxylicivirga sp.]